MLSFISLGLRRGAVERIRLAPESPSGSLPAGVVVPAEAGTAATNSPAVAVATPPASRRAGDGCLSACGNNGRVRQQHDLPAP